MHLDGSKMSFDKGLLEGAIGLEIPQNRRMSDLKSFSPASQICPTACAAWTVIIARRQDGFRVDFYFLKQDVIDLLHGPLFRVKVASDMGLFRSLSWLTQPVENRAKLAPDSPWLSWSKMPKIVSRLGGHNCPEVGRFLGRFSVSEKGHKWHI